MKLKPDHPMFDLSLDLEVGDRVLLQAKPQTEPRAGQIVAVVREEDDPYKCVPPGCSIPAAGYGRPRETRSYLVRLDRAGRVAYWPKVSTIRIAKAA